MAEIIITIPNTIVDRVVEALCSGQSPTAEKAKKEVIDMIRNRVKSYEAQNAAQEAYKARERNIDTNIVLS